MHTKRICIRLIRGRKPNWRYMPCFQALRSVGSLTQLALPLSSADSTALFVCPWNENLRIIPIPATLLGLPAEVPWGKEDASVAQWHSLCSGTTTGLPTGLSNKTGTTSHSCLPFRRRIWGEVRLAHPYCLPLPRSADVNHCQGMRALGTWLGARAGPFVSPARTQMFSQREP